MCYLRPDYTQVKSYEFEVDHAEAEELAAQSVRVWALAPCTVTH